MTSPSSSDPELQALIEAPRTVALPSSDAALLALVLRLEQQLATQDLAVAAAARHLARRLPRALHERLLGALLVSTLDPETGQTTPATDAAFFLLDTLLDAPEPPSGRSSGAPVTPEGAERLAALLITGRRARATPAVLRAVLGDLVATPGLSWVEVAEARQRSAARAGPAGRGRPVTAAPDVQVEAQQLLQAVRTRWAALSADERAGHAEQGHDLGVAAAALDTRLQELAPALDLVGSAPGPRAPGQAPGAAPAPRAASMRQSR